MESPTTTAADAEGRSILGADGNGALTSQRSHWEHALHEVPDRYGIGPSLPAERALAAIEATGGIEILELGCGQGRDTLPLARGGLRVTATDFAPSALRATAQKARDSGLAGSITVVELDVRRPLPFGDASFDGCYSHMLFCMALTERELADLAGELLRIVRPGGLCIYTARTTGDPDFGRGEHLGESLYALDGFVVHFFDRELIDRLAAGFDLLEVALFEEGPLPRRLARVTMRRPVASLQGS